MKSKRLMVLYVLMLVILTGCVQAKVSVLMGEYDGGVVTLSLLMEQSIYERSTPEMEAQAGLDKFVKGEPVEVDGETYIPFTFTEQYDTYAAMEQGLKEIKALPESVNALETSTDSEQTNTKGLFSEVDVNKTDTSTGAIYTFRALVQKQGEATIEEPKTEEPKTEEPKTEEPKTEGTNTAEEKPVEEKPVEEKPVEEKPVEEKPVEEKPVEEKPAEEKPVEEKPAEEKPAEEKPVEPTTETTPNTDDKPAVNYSQGINAMYKMTIEVTLPTEIQQTEGGEVVGNTVFYKIDDLTVDNLIYASGELVIPYEEEQPVDDDFELPEVDTRPRGNISVYPKAFLFSYLITGTLAGIYVGVSELLKRKK